METKTIKERNDIIQTKLKRKCCRKVFASLNDEDLSELKSLMLLVEYRKGDLIFQEGSIADGIYIVYKGFVLYGKRVDNKKEQRRIFRLIGPEEILGEKTLFSKNPCSHFGYARALTDTNLIFLGKDALLSFIEKHSSVFFDLSRELIKNLNTLESRLMYSASGTVHENLSLFLLDAAKKFGLDKGSKIHIPLSLQQGILADILGISVESIAKAISKLKERGVISLQNGEIVILSEDKLKKLAPGPAFAEKGLSTSKLI